MYDTVRELRAARGARLGAAQRKLPALHFALLFALALAELSVSRRRSPALADEAEAPSLPLSSVFPLLGAATADVSESILAPEALLFGAMSGGVALVLALCVQLWTPLGTSNPPPLPRILRI